MKIFLETIDNDVDHKLKFLSKNLFNQSNDVKSKVNELRTFVNGKISKLISTKSPEKEDTQKQIDDIREDVAKIDFQELSEWYANEREIIEERTKAQDTKIESMFKQVNDFRELVQNVAIPMNSSRICISYAEIVSESIKKYPRCK